MLCTTFTLLASPTWASCSDAQHQTPRDESALNCWVVHVLPGIRLQLLGTCMALGSHESLNRWCYLNHGQAWLVSKHSVMSIMDKWWEKLQKSLITKQNNPNQQWFPSEHDLRLSTVLRLLQYTCCPTTSFLKYIVRPLAMHCGIVCVTRCGGGWYKKLCNGQWCVLLNM